MKLGDLVRWIGFPGASPNFDEKHAEAIGVGLIVKVRQIGGSDRFDVVWSDGSLGTRIYPQCLELLDENG